MASTQCLLAGPRHVVADPTSACRAPPVCARAAMVTLKARGKRRRWPARSWPEAAMAAAVCAALGASTATSAVGDEALDEASSAEAGEAASVDLGAAPPWGPKDRMRLSRPASLAQTTPARLASLAQIRTALSSRLRLPISVSSPCLACALACGWRGGPRRLPWPQLPCGLPAVGIPCRWPQRGACDVPARAVGAAPDASAAAARLGASVATAPGACVRGGGRRRAAAPQGVRAHVRARVCVRLRVIVYVRRARGAPSVPVLCARRRLVARGLHGRRIPPSVGVS